MNDKEFPRGLFAKAPHPNAPEFVKTGLSIKVADFGDWMREKKAKGELGEWLNFQVKEGKSGKWYIEVDNFDPKSRDERPAQPEDFEDDDVPF